MQTQGAVKATYAGLMKEKASELEAAKNALANDLADAVGRKDWTEFLRDRHDVESLIERIELMRRDETFLAAIHATADHAREAQGRGRGRPKKVDAQAGAAKSAKNEPGVR
jgi:hypothetical protein